MECSGRWRTHLLLWGRDLWIFCAILSWFPMPISEMYIKSRLLNIASLSEILTSLHEGTIHSEVSVNRARRLTPDTRRAGLAAHATQNFPFTLISARRKWIRNVRRRFLGVNNSKQQVVISNRDSTFIACLEFVKGTILLARFEQFSTNSSMVLFLWSLGTQDMADCTGMAVGKQAALPQLHDSIGKRIFNSFNWQPALFVAAQVAFAFCLLLNVHFPTKDRISGFFFFRFCKSKHIYSTD